MQESGIIEFEYVNTLDNVVDILTKDLSVIRREKVIVVTDKETGGFEEFVVVDPISVTEEIWFPRGGTKKFCWKSYGAFAMRDIADNNGNDKVCGFVTS